MDRQRGRAWTEVRALIYRAPYYLLVKPITDPQAAWEFPGCRVPLRASPEDVLRRLCQERLGIDLGEVVGQPALTHSFGTHTVTYQYYLCPVARDEATPVGYAELRWVPGSQLREYALDAPTQLIIDRLPGAVQD